MCLNGMKGIEAMEGDVKMHEGEGRASARPKGELRRRTRGSASLPNCQHVTILRAIR